MVKVNHYDSSTGAVMTSGEMRMLNIRLKLDLDSKMNKTPAEKELAKFLNNPKYQVCMVGIGDDKIGDRNPFTLAIYNQTQGRDGQDYINCRYIQGTLQGDLTHYQFNSELSEYEDLPKATREEADAVYHCIYKPADPVYDESASEANETDNAVSDDDSYRAHL